MMLYVQIRKKFILRVPNFVLCTKESEKPAIFTLFFLLGPRNRAKKKKSAMRGHYCLYVTHDGPTHQFSDSQDHALPRDLVRCLKKKTD